MQLSLRPSLLLAAFFFVFNWSLFGQSFQENDLAPCGYRGKSEWLMAYQRGEIATPRASCDSLIVGVKLHIVGTSSGGGYINMQRMASAFQVLQEDYAAHDIYLYIDGAINFIDNSSFYDHTVSVGRTMMGLNNVAGLVNTYIVDSPNGNCGYYSGTGDAIALAISCTNATSRTWSHEIGHYLSLPHTFVGWSSEDPLPLETPAPSFLNNRAVEKVDSSNCETASDGFCDTPPDYLAFRWSCNSAGVYPDSLLDPDNVRFAVPGWPIMGYSSQQCRSSGGFSQEQAAAMRANILSRGNHAQCIPFGSTAAVGEDISLLSPENGEDLAATDELSAQLSWTSVPNADFYVVQLNRSQFFGQALLKEITLPATDTSLSITEADGLQFNRRLYWRVLPINRFRPLSEPSEIYNFRITELLSATQDPVLSSAIRLFPNPLKAGNRQMLIQANGLERSSKLRLAIFNLQGQLLLEEQIRQVSNNGQLEHSLSVEGLATGVYFLRILQDDRIVTKRFVIGR